MARHYTTEGTIVNRSIAIELNISLSFREKTLEFIRSCLETETAQIGVLVSQGLEVRTSLDESTR
jgi:hypothetical protein